MSVVDYIESGLLDFHTKNCVDKAEESIRAALARIGEPIPADFERHLEYEHERHRARNLSRFMEKPLEERVAFLAREDEKYRASFGSA